MLQIKYTSKTNKLRKRDQILWLSEALDKSGQKTQTFNYKISARDVRYSMINIINTAICMKNC